MKWIIYVCLSLLPCLSYGNPQLKQAEAEQVLSQALRHKALYWNPFPLPYTINQTSQDKDALLLAALFKHGLVTREVVLSPDPKLGGYLQQWRYQYPTQRSPALPEGFYYGRAKLVALLSLSAVTLVDGEYYAQTRVAWQVDNLQNWAKDPEFRTARTLRRSQMSATEPFENDVVLHYNLRFKAWELWQPLDF